MDYGDTSRNIVGATGKDTRSTMFSEMNRQHHAQRAHQQTHFSSLSASPQTVSMRGAMDQEYPGEQEAFFAKLNSTGHLRNQTTYDARRAELLTDSDNG